MAKYRVFATSKTKYCIDIEAKDEFDAWLKASKADGGDFEELDSMYGAGDWEIDPGEIMRL